MSSRQDSQIFAKKDTMTIIIKGDGELVLKHLSHFAGMLLKRVSMSGVEFSGDSDFAIQVLEHLDQGVLLELGMNEFGKQPSLRFTLHGTKDELMGYIKTNCTENLYCYRFKFVQFATLPCDFLICLFHSVKNGHVDLEIDEIEAGNKVPLDAAEKAVYLELWNQSQKGHPEQLVKTYPGSGQASKPWSNAGMQVSNPPDSVPPASVFESKKLGGLSVETPRDKSPVPEESRSHGIYSKFDGTTHFIFHGIGPISRVSAGGLTLKLKFEGEKMKVMIIVTLSDPLGDVRVIWSRPTFLGLGVILGFPVNTNPNIYRITLSTDVSLGLNEFASRVEKYLLHLASELSVRKISSAHS